MPPAGAFAGRRDLARRDRDTKGDGPEDTGPSLSQRREEAAPSGGNLILSGSVVHHELVDDLLGRRLVRG